MMILLSTIVAQGQIKIGGNVYGGGNEGYVQGNTNVTVLAGDIGARLDEGTEASKHPAGKVFGGARKADVGGNTFVHIDGEHASADMLINQVYGGNDVSGVVGNKMDDENYTKRPVPSVLAAEAAADGVDNTWNTFVLVSSKMTTKAVHYTQAECDEYNTENNLSRGDYGYLTTRHVNPLTPGVLDPTNKNIFIGQLFGGGNGDFIYTSDGEGTYTVTEGEGNAEVTLATKAVKPDLARSYIAIHGGTIADSYGGGNGVTVTEQAVVCVDNPSQVVTNAEVKTMLGTEDDNVMNARYEEMGFTILSQTASSAFQMGSVFGGNKSAEMAIRPTWHLQDGKIRNLYSGGNRGDMTYKDGLFLEIPTYSSVLVDNVYGGCRMADVNPKEDGVKVAMVSSEDLLPYQFPPNLAARVIVAGGDVNNVYGGNDVRGKVYFGNAVGIQASVRGNVYGGGNGAYAYTDREGNKDSKQYRDYYYDLVKEDGSNYSNSIEALNALRPNAEQVSIQVRGFKEKKTIIKGSIFVGGNCASLVTDPAHASLANYPLTELKVGSYVIAENVFLGNNGEDMVSPDILEKYNDRSFSSLIDNLPLGDDFAAYMGGVSLAQVPELVVEDEQQGDRVSYKPYTSYIGSLYYGGNRGSMTYKNPINIKPDAEIYIYNKLVAGCNNANVSASLYNARYEGGILGSAVDGEVDAQTGNPTYTDGSGNIRDRIVMNLSKIRLKPMRLNSEGTDLEWNTVFMVDKYEAVADGTTLTAGKIYYTSSSGGGEFSAAGTEVANGTNYYVKTYEWEKTDTGSGDGTATDADKKRRLYGANVYGGCYTSGHVNGNVVITLNDNLLNRKEVFAAFEGEEVGDNILYGYESYTLKAPRNSGVILNEQGMDVLGEALTVFGGGKGKETEIWGSTTVNINKGYTFQVFGGSEEGAIGKGTWNSDTNKYDYPPEADDKYSTHVNLCGTVEGEARGESGTSVSKEIPDVEFIYGGGFSGPIIGNTYVHLDNGRLFNLFAGSCNADINGHTETYVGLNGFPYLRDHIYGGNDLGGSIKGEKDFESLVRAEALPMVHAHNGNRDVLKASSYVEYRQGAMKEIFGGCFGDYDYEKEYKDFAVSIPWLHNAFVNFRPDDHGSNHVDKVFGAGEGMAGIRIGDKMQDRSYVLIDIPDGIDSYKTMEVFGSGSNNGLGMGFGKDENDEFVTLKPGFDLDLASAVIDLLRGKIGNVFGGSYNEGVTRRTVVNVPENSTIWLYSTEPDYDDPPTNQIKHEKNYGSIYGGAYGTQILPPCDVFESVVNYKSDQAIVNGAIYGGNNNERRTLRTQVNISAPVWSNELKAEKGYTASVYGAGRGVDTWAEYTEVNLLSGANVYEVYGGGMMGHVLNTESVQQYMKLYQGGPSAQIAHDDPDWNQRYSNWTEAWTDAWTLGDYFTPTNFTDSYVNSSVTNLSGVEARSELVADAKAASQLGNADMKYNTNVIIHEGATVSGYAYAGGYGKKATAHSGDIYGSTYLALLGGTVSKDIYGGGTAGSVDDLFGTGAYDAVNNLYGFTASTNVYILGGTARNVYGGGWQGNIGAIKGHAGLSKDYPGATHVVIGKTGSDSFASGDPAVQRNAYGGGEGGSVIGTANITLNNGHIGYVHLTASEKQDEKGKVVAAESSEGLEERYEEKMNDETYYEENEWKGENRLEDLGNVYGSGYDDVSSVDYSNVILYGGLVRNSVFGGGEVAIVGRGTKASADAAPVITKAGLTNVTMYNGHVLNNVYGGGKGYNNLKYGVGNKLYTDGYVFGGTRVNIHGGEIGTEKGVRMSTEIGDVGNVFGGGDAGLVYSAYELSDGTIAYGKKSGGRYDDGDEGYYYKYENDDFVKDNNEKVLTEDCKVVVEPMLQATKAFSGYAVGDYVPISVLNTLPNKSGDDWSGNWSNVDVGTPDHERGVIIHNGVFAGGNKPVGSNQLSANAKTIFGNATASIHDVYHRDFITLGTGRVGGLYGDGNLTLVDGYRELNITNYGTDFYHIAQEIDRETYDGLFPREQAYYEIRYKCEAECHDKDGTEYHPQDADKGINASNISAEELELLFLTDGENGSKVSVKEKGTPVLKQLEDGKWVPNTDGSDKPIFWSENGLRSRYAGRTMNTIQRADFCGVFGSRMEMLGAEDRVLTQQDHTKYTINRVREVSLNKKESTANDGVTHGNYFGIYSNVHYLGALTSDFDFGDANTRTYPRLTDNPRTDIYKTAANGQPYETASFFDWKKQYPKDNRRNNGLSHNELALASGVYLELTTEKKEGKGLDLYEKDWGLITGVVQLDLINVTTGVGGGYVYAKNVHGVRLATNKKQTTLTSLNTGAATKKAWKYVETDGTLTGDNAEQLIFQTSGNFVHNTQTIIDDCYNIGNKYKLNDNPVPAHYWYIKGSVYVYDQYISAYTGAANAYNEKTEIPLTITAASNGRLTLIDVQPNLYAYYANAQKQKLGGDKKLVINDKTYHLNDTITYWDWSRLSASEKELFVPKTYINSVACHIDDTWYEAGTYVMNESEYNDFKAQEHIYKDINGYDLYELLNGQKQKAGTDYVIRPSNNLSHDNGFILTYQVNNPAVWDKWYTLKEDKTEDTKTSITKKDYDGLPKTGDENVDSQDKYWDGPTYTPTTSGLYGQHRYRVGDIISQDIETTYKKIDSDNIPTNDPTASDYDEDRVQATFTRAYITTEAMDVKKLDLSTAVSDDTKDQHYEKGAKLAEEEFSTAEWNAMSGKVAEAWVCTSTIQISEDDFILPAELVTADEVATDKAKLNTNISTLLSGKDFTSERITEIQGMEASELETVLTDAEKTALGYDGLMSLKGMLSAKEALDISENPNPNSCLQKAYYCIEEGMYGGNYFVSGKNYRGIESWCSMTDAERKKFTFNYDALDLLIDPDYSKDETGRLTLYAEGQKYQYDGYDSYDERNKDNMLYSLSKPVDYVAEFTGKYKDANGSEVTIDNPPSYKQNGNGASKTVSVTDKLTPAEFETIPNEQRHYSKISVTDANNEGTAESPVYKVYVVNKYFNNNDGSYAVGSTFVKEEYGRLSSADQANVTILTFSATSATPYYYCRQAYEVGEKGYGSGVTNIVDNESYSNGQVVPLGAVITETDYKKLTNKQLGFIISGVSPTESTTFYVSRDADIRDLSKEKIITVIYQYDYEESDESGSTITPYSERHILNIHLQLKSGVPTIADIKEPGIVLPGTSVEPQAPKVTPGAYEVIGTGWELFREPSDADIGYNGKPYDPAQDEVYWYQDKYHIAYYADTYLGRTYSNHVPVHVANYHDLKKVMDDKENHYFIDHKDVAREPKIYINDYTKVDENGVTTSESQNGLDLLKNIIDLSYVTKTYDSDGKPLPISDADSPLKDHIPFEHHADKPMKGGQYLEFFLRTDIDHSKKWVTNPAHASDPTTPEFIQTDNPWTPIASGTGECFSGILHGDGHTISGLAPAEGTTGSLIDKLCGKVYNLGVMGSFNGAGIANTGEGHVESCWVKTSATTPVDGTKPYAVFGNPSGDGYQLVNSYFWKGNKNLYSIAGDNPEVDDNAETITSGGDRGVATAMSGRAFYNGELAYDLNNFYLHKRYRDKETVSGEDTKSYAYLTLDANGKVSDNVSTGFYPNSTDASYCDLGYVEGRFADGDFRYADGIIRTSQDERYYMVVDVNNNGEETVAEEDKLHFAPIWPDDYLFFGQTLTYDHVEGRTHQETPSYIIRNDENKRVVMDVTGNRVYRAPAYYRNSKMDVAHFNTDAVFAKSKKNHADDIAYENMTAIDFTGHNDVTYPYEKGWKQWSKTSQAEDGKSTDAYAFYPPLLDDGGLISFTNIDLTKNLLAYTADEGENTTAAERTATAVKTHLTESAYEESDTKYRTVATRQTSGIHGHWVKMVANGSFEAFNDHLLVDKQDFDAPMSYSFAEGKRMWYQRIPEDNEYVDRKKGWQAISLPFTAELVTTNQKGEITHFYSGSYDFYDKNTGRKDGKSEKVGHEYWLRELTGDLAVKAGTDNKVLTAGFAYPIGADSDPEKEVTNTFLWDFYYQGVAGGHNQKDYNKDTYQEYYSDKRVYEDYPLLANGTPYVLGLPGTTYYEFDLSGRFDTNTTDSPKPQHELIDKQTITFASVPGITIKVSDKEKDGKDEQGRYKWKRTVRIGNNDVDYYFKANYLNQSFKAGTSNFTLHAEYDSNGDGEADCSSFVKVPDAAGVGESSVADTELAAFRPFFTTDATPVNTRSIVFGSVQMEEQKGVEEHGDPTKEELNGGLRIWTKKDKIFVESSLKFTEDMRVVTPAGITVATFSVKPGQTKEIQADFSGLYIVHTLDGLYTKKVYVRK